MSFFGGESDRLGPQPLAILSGDLSIYDVIERLKQLQEQRPDAVVKRGRANRWELWTPEGTIT